MTSERNLNLEAEQYFKETCEILRRDHQNAFQKMIEKYEKLIVEDTDPIILDGETFKPIDGRIYKPAPLGSLTGYNTSDEIKKRIKIYQEMAFKPSKRVGYKTKAPKKKRAKARKKPAISVVTQEEELISEHTQDEELISEKSCDTQNEELISEKDWDTEDEELISEEGCDTQDEELISEEGCDTQDEELISEKGCDTKDEKLDSAAAMYEADLKEMCKEFLTKPKSETSKYKQKNQTSQSQPTTSSEGAYDFSPSTSEDEKVKDSSSSSRENLQNIPFSDKCSKKGDMHNFDHAEKSYKRTPSKSVGQDDLDEMYVSRKYTASFHDNDYLSPNESYRDDGNLSECGILQASLSMNVHPKQHTVTVTTKLNDTLRQKKSPTTPDYRQQPERKLRGKQQMLDLTAIVNHDNTSKRTKSFSSTPKYQNQKKIEMKTKVTVLTRSSPSQDCFEHALESILSNKPNSILSHSAHNGQSRYVTNKKSTKSNISFPTGLNNESQTPNSVSRRRIRSELFHDSSENYALPIKRKRTSQVKSCQKRSRSPGFEEKYEAVNTSMEVLWSMK